jgi:diguanylate cyclase (GGDEF)-like protein
MQTDDRPAAGPESPDGQVIAARAPMVDPQAGLDADRAAADADQTVADADQTSSDEDQTASTTDQAGADRDQLASDRDQATADRDQAVDGPLTADEQAAYDTSREERESVSVERLETRLARANTARRRDLTASDRDRLAEARDEAARLRDERASRLTLVAAEPETSLLQQLEQLATEAAADRARAAADRARAAADRANAARERERLEAELHSAHLDALTGTYRREMGHMALTNEIDRARRSDGRFVLAFVDVDRLKDINDRDGHAAGDSALQAVVAAIRSRLRSFDPIVRYGGDEFVCGLGGLDIEEAKRRFDAISLALEGETQVSISVGLAALEAGETAEELTQRADVAMLEIRAKHRQRL